MLEGIVSICSQIRFTTKGYPPEDAETPAYRVGNIIGLIPKPAKTPPTYLGIVGTILGSGRQVDGIIANTDVVVVAVVVVQSIGIVLDRRAQQCRAFVTDQLMSLMQFI
ncbi:hypothetical protein FB451DRAFT_1180831 [Mycena latifolia]|nr:hypothetical protein FB451DRAFT_1180831 [Mycena latifolia]